MCVACVASCTMSFTACDRQSLSPLAKNLRARSTSVTEQRFQKFDLKKKKSKCPVCGMVYLHHHNLMAHLKTTHESL